MTVGGEHVVIPKALLWTIAISIMTGLAGGSFWLGELSQRVAILEKATVTVDAIGTRVDAIGGRIDGVNQRLATIDERLRFVLLHDFPGQQGSVFNSPSSDRADK